MMPQAVLDQLIILCPGFQESWDDASNGFRHDDGTFTTHGVFAQFSRYFRDHCATLTADKLAAIGAFISSCMTSTDEELDNAAATCFVEHVAGEEYDRRLGQYLTGEALTYYLAWGGRA